MNIILRLIINALGVMVAASVVPGIIVDSFWTALVVAIVLAVLNVTLGFLLKVLTLPLSIVTFGLFLLVINAFVFYLATFVKGFYISGFWAAFFGSIIVTLVSMLGRRLLDK